MDNISEYSKDFFVVEEDATLRRNRWKMPGSRIIRCSRKVKVKGICCGQYRKINPLQKVLNQLLRAVESVFSVWRSKFFASAVKKQRWELFCSTIHFKFNICFFIIFVFVLRTIYSWHSFYLIFFFSLLVFAVYLKLFNFLSISGWFLEIDLLLDVFNISSHSGKNNSCRPRSGSEAKSGNS